MLILPKVEGDFSPFFYFLMPPRITNFTALPLCVLLVRLKTLLSFFGFSFVRFILPPFEKLCQWALY